MLQIARAINQGKLVPEEIIFRLLSKRLEDGFFYNGETGFILDGIPRTRTQAVSHRPFTVEFDVHIYQHFIWLLFTSLSVSLMLGEETS